jgi:hypothetical protein
MGISSRVIVTGSLLLSLVRPVGAVPPLDLRGNTFSGTYVPSGSGSQQTLQIEIEKQHRRRLRVSVFAMNLPEFQGPGKLSKDNTTVTATTRATGKGNVPRFLITATVSDGGNTLSGSYTLKAKGRADVTGTFSVGR